MTIKNKNQKENTMTEFHITSTLKRITILEQAIKENEGAFLDW